LRCGLDGLAADGFRGAARFPFDFVLLDGIALYCLLCGDVLSRHALGDRLNVLLGRRHLDAAGAQCCPDILAPLWQVLLDDALDLGNPFGAVHNLRLERIEALAKGSNSLLLCRSLIPCRQIRVGLA
jgi:hypothetical protein